MSSYLSALNAVKVIKESGGMALTEEELAQLIEGLTQTTTALSNGSKVEIGSISEERQEQALNDLKAFIRNLEQKKTQVSGDEKLLVIPGTINEAMVGATMESFWNFTRTLNLIEVAGWVAPLDENVAKAAGALVQARKAITEPLTTALKQTEMVRGQIKESETKPESQESDPSQKVKDSFTRQWIEILKEREANPFEYKEITFADKSQIQTLVKGDDNTPSLIKNLGEASGKLGLQSSEIMKAMLKAAGELAGDAKTLSAESVKAIMEYDKLAVQAMKAFSDKVTAQEEALRTLETEVIEQTKRGTIDSTAIERLQKSIEELAKANEGAMAIGRAFEQMEKVRDIVKEQVKTQTPSTQR